MTDAPFRLPLTAEEFDELPPVDGWRMELWDGNLDVAPAAQMAWHSMTMREIARLLAAAGRVVHTEVGVVLASRTVRAPDVTRFRPGVRVDVDRSQFPVTDVDLVAEIVSPESESRDRKIKPEEYAAAGIPEFWLVERHPDDRDDATVRRCDGATVNIYRLTPSRMYGLVRTMALSALEQEIER